MTERAICVIDIVIIHTSIQLISQLLLKYIGTLDVVDCTDTFCEVLAVLQHAKCQCDVCNVPYCTLLISALSTKASPACACLWLTALSALQDVRYLKPYLEEVRKENREKAEWSKK